MSVNRIYHLRTKPLAEKVFRGPHHDSVFLKEMRESLPGLSLDRTPDLHPFLVPSLIPGQPTVCQTSDRNRSHIYVLLTTVLPARGRSPSPHCHRRPLQSLGGPHFLHCLHDLQCVILTFALLHTKLLSLKRKGKQYPSKIYFKVSQLCCLGPLDFFICAFPYYHYHLLFVVTTLSPCNLWIWTGQGWPGKAGTSH